MQTQIFTPSQIEQAARLIRSDEIVAFPTETVYGLGASIFSKIAIAKIFRAKGRPQDNPLIAHISALDQVESLSKGVPESFYLLADAFFPGPLTLVVNRGESVPQIASGGLSTIAIRQPNCEIAHALIAAVGTPLVAPSANLSGRPSSTSADHVLSDLKGLIAGVIDGGRTNIGIESTVLDLVSFERPTILRPGKVTKSEIESVLGVEIDIYTSGPKASPGMQYRHYAPEAPVRVFHDRALLEGYLALAPHCRRLLLSEMPIKGSFDHFLLKTESFYSILRLADQEHYEEVVILCDHTINAGLMNRIEKLEGCESHCH